MNKKKLLYTIVFPLHIFISVSTVRANEGWLYSEITILNVISFFLMGMMFSQFKERMQERAKSKWWVFLFYGFVICIYQGCNSFDKPPNVDDFLFISCKMALRSTGMH